jgi:hypothetical protein
MVSLERKFLIACEDIPAVQSNARRSERGDRFDVGANPTHNCSSQSRRVCIASYDRLDCCSNFATPNGGQSITNSTRDCHREATRNNVSNNTWRDDRGSVNERDAEPKR